LSLHPVVVAMLEQMARDNRPALSAGTPEDSRAMLRATRAALGGGPQLPIVRDLRLPTRSGTIAARFYGPEAPTGLIVYLHGGGWVLGEIDDFDAMARTLASRSRCAVLMPAYRLAPEHSFPAGLEDAEDSIHWASDHVADLAGKVVPLVVAGDSAGGNLATVATRNLGDRIRIACQALIYPVTDSDTTTPSYREHGDGLPLTRKDMGWFFGHYAPSTLLGDPRISPLRNVTAGMPTTIVITAEYDVLRDEGERYAELLSQAGVPVIARRVDGLLHGFIRMHNLIDTADDALSALAADIANICATA
jgi:acetyl esterase